MVVCVRPLNYLQKKIVHDVVLVSIVQFLDILVKM